MNDYDAATYGDRIADVYDEQARHFDPGPPVEYLARLAGDGPALELGIGTGRLALPLAARGVAIQGVEGSPRMVEKLRQKPGGAAIPVVVGDFCEVAPEGRFPLVFIAFNTFFAALTQDDQVRLCQNVARHLAPGGAFVVEAFVPDLGRFDRGQRTSASDLGAAMVQLEVAQHDPVAQHIAIQTVVLTPAGTQFYPLRIRYAWPAELDLMARLAGLTLRARYGGWGEEPFTAGSGLHVSVYERAPDGVS